MLPAFSVEYRLSVFVSIFADDIKIAAKLKSADDTQILQRAIDYLEKSMVQLKWPTSEH